MATKRSRNETYARIRDTSEPLPRVEASRVAQALIRWLKHHRKEGRIVHSALASLASLRQLQTLDS